jgi:hypothetical protein
MPMTFLVLSVSGAFVPVTSAYVSCSLTASNSTSCIVLSLDVLRDRCSHAKHAGIADLVHQVAEVCHSCPQDILQHDVHEPPL